MIKVKIEVGFDIENPNDNAAISEVRKWKVLQEKGDKKNYLSEQKTVFMAGLYLHAIAPQLCNKLAQNLAVASLDDLEYFNQSILEKGTKELQLEGVLNKLSEIQALINTTIETSKPLTVGDEVKVAQVPTEQVPILLPETKGVRASVDQDVELKDRLKKIAKIKSNNIF